MAFLMSVKGACIWFNLGLAIWLNTFLSTIPLERNLCDDVMQQ